MEKAHLQQIVDAIKTANAQNRVDKAISVPIAGITAEQAKAYNSAMPSLRAQLKADAAHLKWPVWVTVRAAEAISLEGIDLS